MQKNDTLIGNLSLAWKLIGSTLGLALLLVGVPIFEVARVTCVILIQSTVGIIIWNFLIPPRNTDAVFRIGSGIFFGIAISTIFQQIFIGSIFSIFCEVEAMKAELSFARPKRLAAGIV